jgi:transposase-like protein
LKKAATRNRFTEEQQHAAVADLENMTVAKVAAKYGCSSASLMTWKKKYGGRAKPAGRAGAVRAASVHPVSAAAALQDDRRVADLEEENKRLRRLLLDGFIAQEQQPKLQRIAGILRDNKLNQIEQIMETLLAAEMGQVEPVTVRLTEVTTPEGDTAFVEQPEVRESGGGEPAEESE